MDIGGQAYNFSIQIERCKHLERYKMVLRNLVHLTVFLFYFICAILVFETLRSMNEGKEFNYVRFICISLAGYVVLHIVVRLLYNCCSERRREELTVLKDTQYALRQEEKKLKTLRKKQEKGAKDLEGQLMMQEPVPLVGMVQKPKQSAPTILKMN